MTESTLSKRVQALSAIAAVQLPANILPPTRLAGIGTAMVESLDHYVARLAVSCASSPRIMAQLVWQSAGRSPSISAHGQIQKSVLDNLEFAQELERLTGVPNLRCGTFCALSNVLNLTRSVSRTRGRQWCPLCYYEWDNLHSYEPLYWSITFASHCAEHLTRLVRNCHHCGAEQTWFRSLARRRVCACCSGSLGFHPPALPATDIERWIDHAVLDLVATCAEPETGVLPKEKAASLIRSILDTRPDKSAPRWCREFRDDVIEVGAQALSIGALLNLCAMRHEQPSHVLLGPPGVEALTLHFDWPKFQLPPVARNNVMIRVEAAASVLEALLRGRRSVLLPFGLTTQYLAQISPGRFTSYCGSVSAAYASQCEAGPEWPAELRVRSAMRSALNIIELRMSRGEPLRLHQLAEHLAQLHTVQYEWTSRAVRGAFRLVAMARKSPVCLLPRVRAVLN